jgi:ketosteroid isomerase-like protein
MSQSTTTAAALPTDVVAWFQYMQGCVQNVDFDRAKPIFSEKAVGFGTYGAMLDGLDTLVAGQWQNIWPTIKGFTFDMDSLRHGEDGKLVWAICRWDSFGKRADGTEYPRPGRATVILERDGDLLKAVHTHFSLVPTPKQSTPQETPSA